MRRHSPSLSLLLFLLLSLLPLFVGTAAGPGFKICSYNLQQFSPKKAANYRVLHTMTRVISRCDICLLQNVMDPQNSAIKRLLSVLNRYDDRHYQLVSSKPLGNASNDMQQYVYLYRNQLVEVVAAYQYNSEGFFLRDPFSINFRSANAEIKDFILVALHSDPSRVVEEIDKLYDVFTFISRKWNNTNVMFLGDFHTACGYMSRADKRKIRLFTDSTFTWLIKDRADTTVNSMISCAYDRIVIYGQPFLKAIRPDSARAFNFGEEFKLHRSQVLEVSDHLPVEVTLKGSALLLQATPLLILLQCVLSAL